MNRALRGLALLLVALAVPSCKDDAPSPPGPDGKPLPGSPKGTAIPDPRGTTAPPMAALILLEDAVREDMKKNPGKNEGTVEVDYPNPPPPSATVKVRVTWRRLENGRYRFTLTNGVSVSVEPSADGKAEIKTYATAPTATGIHYGPGYFFVGSAGCADAIWVQYVKREFKFQDATGADKGAPVKGPEIDQQVPYKNQSQPAPGSPNMEDAPGINAPLGQTPKETAPGALARLKRDAGVTDNSITKATVTWSFWTYLICLKPTYHVVGHYEWGFTLTVDVNNAPYISESGARPPVWTSGN